MSNYLDEVGPPLSARRVSATQVEYLSRLFGGSVIELQRSAGITQDGIFGPISQAALKAAALNEISEDSSALSCGAAADGLQRSNWSTSAKLSALTPIPRGRAELERVYGEIRYTVPKGGNTPRVVNRYFTQKILRAEFEIDGRVFGVRIHRAISSEFEAVLREAVAESGYLPETAQGAVLRFIGRDPKNPLSLHSYGVAVDFDPRKNWVGGKNLVDGGESILRKHSEFIRVFERHGWTWGGRFKSMDDMHFQRAFV